MTRHDERITSLHGAGGEVMGELLERLILPRFAGKGGGRIDLAALDDGATIPLPEGQTGELVLTTDSHVVKPIFFPGGDIGLLAAAGTLNDLAVMGARPIALTLAAVIEEGFPVADLERILDSFAAALESVGATVACGDTKVMPAGDIDGIVLNTTGVGIATRAISDAELTPGDRVLVTGSIGDHGMALLAAREEFNLETELQSDVAVVWPMLEPAIEAGDVRAMKDPTRGGLAASLNEMARKSDTCIELEEWTIPIREAVHGLSELLGISPLEVANEGKAVLVVAADAAERVLAQLQGHPLGREAAIIGRVTDEHPGRVILDTQVGGRRFLDMPLGDPVPRIC
ncbi:MAG: hydrogenase expression/formation protein HypE [Thermoanaerobaculales bacterium]|nr:hydrogenase expression/formation protein HypE [Thermoanaerobaculales bacterium]